MTDENRQFTVALIAQLSVLGALSLIALVVWLVRG
jgi:hypothetical protein